jgi:hypothetical protein
MFRKSVIALAALATLAGAAAPALAETNTNDVFGPGNAEYQQFMEQHVLNELRAKGIDAVSVDQWGGLIQAFVTAENGQQRIEYFTPDTLAPVPFNG